MLACRSFHCGSYTTAVRLTLASSAMLLVVHADLVGGVASVTLGDEEARTRGTQKSVLERKGPATFPIVVEMRDRGAWVAHDTAESVDTLLKSKIPKVQVGFTCMCLVARNII